MLAATKEGTKVLPLFGTVNKPNVLVCNQQQGMSYQLWLNAYDIKTVEEQVYYIWHIQESIPLVTSTCVLHISTHT